MNMLSWLTTVLLCTTHVFFNSLKEILKIGLKIMMRCFLICFLRNTYVRDKFINLDYRKSIVKA